MQRRHSTHCVKAWRRRSAAWAFHFHRRCSASPVRWCSASSILQTSQAQNRFHTDLEDWLATTVRELGSDGAASRWPHWRPTAAASADIRAAMDRMRDVIAETGSSKAATTAMANLAEAIQGLVHHMRTEQQMIRNWG